MTLSVRVAPGLVVVNGVVLIAFRAELDCLRLAVNREHGYILLLIIGAGLADLNKFDCHFDLEIEIINFEIKHFSNHIKAKV